MYNFFIFIQYTWVVVAIRKMMDAGPGGRADSALELPRLVVLFFGTGGANFFSLKV